MKNKIDKEYRKDHDYLIELQQFTNKDMLIFSLHQEWVKRRYSKPDSKRSLGFSIIGILFGVLALTWKLKDDPVVVFIMIISAVLLLSSALSILKELMFEEKSEIDKLNEIRFAIEELSK